MHTKQITKLLLGTAVASAIGMAGSNVFAEDAAQIEAGPSGAVTYDNASGAYPVVTAVLSLPGSLDGYTYTSDSFLAEDSSGSLDMFYSSTASSYTPTVGDAVTVAGAYGPYQGLPEIGKPLTITQESTGNTVPAPLLETVSAINLTATNSEALLGSAAGYLIQLDNVTLGNAGSTWATHANVTTSVTDNTGTMILYDWASSYSVDGALGGTAVPTGPVDVTGFIDFYAPSSETEFIPVSIVSVPEPTAMSLCGLGSILVGMFSYRLRKKA
jgi:hypothetical protein